ncbi:helix-turn-helix transcriptional regulator [uncultured Agrococcus sp.]|uniref:PadR family transcriptional regulator n=1 Tax=uncultured Agrococcus sp. TaxID=382258 RepID=UPI0025CE6593|nr:helix-turn-helix transcriptional regulator [uncultured Agrococcus sp.]
MTEITEWPAQWLRGPLSLCALRVIAESGPVHGYGIARALEDAGLGSIGGGTLYPMLGRLERDALVTTDWVAGENGPAKKTYTITSLGAEQLEQEGARWARFSTATAALIEGASKEER